MFDGAAGGVKLDYFEISIVKCAGLITSHATITKTGFTLPASLKDIYRRRTSLIHELTCTVDCPVCGLRAISNKESQLRRLDSLRYLKVCNR
jgi:hypothetical protein